MSEYFNFPYDKDFKNGYEAGYEAGYNACKKELEIFDAVTFIKEKRKMCEEYDYECLKTGCPMAKKMLNSNFCTPEDIDSIMCVGFIECKPELAAHVIAKEVLRKEKKNA